MIEREPFWHGYAYGVCTGVLVGVLVWMLVERFTPVEPPRASLPSGPTTLGLLDQGMAQLVTRSTLQIRASATYPDDTLIGALCTVGFEARTVVDYDGDTDTAEVWPAWTESWIEPLREREYRCYVQAPLASSSDAVNAEQIAADAWDAMCAESDTCLPEPGVER